MQSHNEYRDDYEKLKERVDNMVPVKPLPNEIQLKKQEAEGLAKEIRERVGPLEQYLSGCGDGQGRPDTHEEYKCQLAMWNGLLQLLDIYTKKCDKLIVNIVDQLKEGSPTK